MCIATRTGLLFALILAPLAALTDPTSTPARFWHVGLVVEDMPLMHAFYADVIGLEPVTDLEVADGQVAKVSERTIVVDRLDALMGLHGTHIEIRHFSDPQHNQFFELMRYRDHPSRQVERGANRPLGLNHLGLQVQSIEQVLERMRARGAGELVGGPMVLPEFGGHRYAFLKDPEGNLVEIFEASGEN